MAFSFLALKMLNIDNTISKTIIVSSIATFLIGLVFMTLSACISSIVKRAERGTRISYLIFLIVFILGIVFDIVNNGSFIKPFTPIKYFDGVDIVKGNLDPVYAVLCIILAGIFCRLRRKLTPTFVNA